METSARVLPSLIFALIFGAVPLVAGCGIFLVWCATGWEWLQAAGMLNILMGLIAFVLGLCCLLSFFIRTMQRRPLDWSQLALGVGAGLLLLANFPVCGVIMNTVFRLQTAQRAEELLAESTIRVVNAGDATIESAAVSGVRLGETTNSIEPGEGSSLSFNARESQDLTIKFADARTSEKTLRLPGAGGNPVDLVALVGMDGDVRIVSLVPRWFGAD